MPVALWAQDEELTLAGLAEQLAALIDRVTAVEAKLEPITTDSGVCVQYAKGQLQRETVTKYLDTFDENIESSLISLDAVHYDAEEGLTIYHFPNCSLTGLSLKLGAVANFSMSAKGKRTNRVAHPSTLAQWSRTHSQRGESN